MQKVEHKNGSVKLCEIDTEEVLTVSVYTTGQMQLKLSSPGDGAPLSSSSWLMNGYGCMEGHAYILYIGRIFFTHSFL